MTSTGWTRAAVQARLIEAERVIARTTDWPMRIRTTATDVPQSIKTEEERMDILRGMHERLKIEGYYDTKTGLLQKPVPLSWGRGLPPTDSIQRAEEAFWWPAAFVQSEVQRICLVSFIWCRAHRTHGFHATIRRRLKSLGLPAPAPRICYTEKDRALSAIVTGLGMARVPVALPEAA